MNVESLAVLVVEACEASQVDYMMTGAFAYGVYAIPRSTKDVDVVIALPEPSTLDQIIRQLDDQVDFGGQVKFDTHTWGRRHVGVVREQRQLQVELFELFDDPFVMAQFERRRQFRSPQLMKEIWVPSAEDVIVQKLRWARPKDLQDALDVIAVQGTESLDLDYIREWCGKHASTGHLEDALAKAAKI